MWFINNNQDRILLNNLPKGRVFKQAWIVGTNFNKLIKWLALSFSWLVDEYNKAFKGLFICQSTFYIEQFKNDFLIPNDIFYKATDEEHKADIIVLKYLMKGNTAWNFTAIANAYGICVDVVAGAEFFKESRLPNTIPHKLYPNYNNINNIITVTFYVSASDVLPHSVPHTLGSGLKVEKIKKIYDIIRPAQTKIEYFSKAQADCEKIKICKG